MYIYIYIHTYIHIYAYPAPPSDSCRSNCLAYSASFSSLGSVASDSQVLKCLGVVRAGNIIWSVVPLGDSSQTALVRGLRYQ